MTNEQRAAWLEGRRTGIGGSDVAAILGLSPWRTPLDVYESKIKQTNDQEVSEAAYWGTTLEDVVAKEFAKRTGVKIQRVNHQFSDGWMIANIDRAIVNPLIAKSVRPIENPTPHEKELYGDRPITTDVALEAKTSNQFNADQWGPSQEPEIKEGKVTTEHVIPMYYETQIQWYCGVLKLRGMFLAVLIGGSDFRMYWIEARPDVFEVLKAKCENFWKEHVEKKVPPEPINIEDVKKLYAKSNGQEIEATGELAIDYGEFSRLSGEIKNLKKQQEAVKAKIAIAMKDNEILTLAGKKVLTYKTQVSKRFDVSKFKEDNYEEYLEYVTEDTKRVMKDCA